MAYVSQLSIHATESRVSFPSRRSLTGAGLLAGFLLLAGCSIDVGDKRERGSRRGDAKTDHQVIELDSGDLMRVNLRMGAGELFINGGSAKLFEGDFRYLDAQGKPQVRYQAQSGRGDLDIEEPHGSWSSGDNDTRWDLKFNDQKAVDFTANLGAGEARLNLGSMNLRNVEIHMGVGELELDLRGKPKRSFDVDVAGGVGEARIHLPENVAIVAKAAGGIGNVQVTGLEKSNGRWIRPGHEDDAIEVRLTVNGGIGSIKID
jgi:hypothetical protein